MKKKIYLCPKCGRALNFSDNPEYTFQCFECDEDFYAFEAKEIEQPRLEGIVDYTELAEATVQIKNITDKAIAESTRQIEIKGKDIVEQIAEYINETINPILSTGLYKDKVFTSRIHIRTSHFCIDFNEYNYYGKPYGAQLFGDNGSLRIYFNRNHEYSIEAQKSHMLPWLVEEWAQLKDSMKRKIAYGLQECDAANKKRLAEQEELSKFISSFRL